MDIIPTNTSTFEGLVSKYAVDAKKSALENLAVWLERIDREPKMEIAFTNFGKIVKNTRGQWWIWCFGPICCNDFVK